MTDQCDANFDELDRDQLAELCSNMHDELHVYADEQEAIRQWVIRMGRGLDLFAQDIASSSTFGKRATALAVAAANAANFATAAYEVAGVTRQDIEEVIEFNEAIAPLLNDPAFGKDTPN